MFHLQRLCTLYPYDIISKCQSSLKFEEHWLNSCLIIVLNQICYFASISSSVEKHCLLSFFLVWEMEKRHRVNIWFNAVLKQCHVLRRRCRAKSKSCLLHFPFRCHSHPATFRNHLLRVWATLGLQDAFVQQLYDMIQHEGGTCQKQSIIHASNLAIVLSATQALISQRQL